LSLGLHGCVRWARAEIPFQAELRILGAALSLAKQRDVTT
jgi:hypothetical protein